MPSVGLFFLDSGAHSLYTEHVLKKNKKGTQDKNAFGYFDTQDFWSYVDKYAEFLKANPSIEYYVNVDVIFDPERSYRTLKYLEKIHGLNPVPVIHFGTDLKWIRKHLADGYEFLGIGGLGQEATRKKYKSWADNVFGILCPKSNDYLPIVRTHGFAMTSFELMLRYPWWSVDSASWVKQAAYGVIYIPHKRGGLFDFSIPPYNVCVSTGNQKSKEKSLEIKSRRRTLVDVDVEARDQKLRYRSLKSAEKAIVCEWLEFVGTNIEEASENWEKRAMVNLKYFHTVCKEKPKPERFVPVYRKGLL